jgi:hypothetical protein
MNRGNFAKTYAIENKTVICSTRDRWHENRGNKKMTREPGMLLKTNISGPREPRMLMKANKLSPETQDVDEKKWD